MIKHGISHGLSVLTCTIIGSLLVELLRPYYPVFLQKLDRISLSFIDRFGLVFSIEQFTIILTASLLAILWGVFFKLSHMRN